MQNILGGRYTTTSESYSPLDKFEDMVTWLAFLKSHDYVVKVLMSGHGYTESQADARAKRITPHARFAIDYINQAINGPETVAFLPTYYAVLNLAKIAILAGPYYGDFDEHAGSHGASYTGRKKTSRSLLTDEISLMKKGVLSLFYRTLTDREIKKKTKVTMLEVWEGIHTIEMEFFFATGKRGKVVHLNGEIVSRNGDQYISVEIENTKPISSTVGIRHLPVLKKFKKINSKLYEKRIAYSDRTQLQNIIEESFEPRYLITCEHCGHYLTALRNSNLKFTQEFPVALMFFHMGSVARYKPEFLATLESSIFWPMLSGGLKHCLYGYIMNIWSYVHQHNQKISSV